MDLYEGSLTITALFVAAAATASFVGFVKRLMREEQPRRWNECWHPRQLGAPRFPFWWKPDQLHHLADCEF